jgi:hypothetical protein
MKLKDLYSEYFAHWISAGNLILRDKISSLGIKASFDRFLTKKYVTKVWSIRYIPVYYDENLTEMVRTEMFLKFPEVKTSVQIFCLPVDIQVNTESYKRKLLSARDRYSNYKEVFDQLSEADQMIGKTVRYGGGSSITIRKEELERLKERYDSFMYVYDHTNKDGKFFEAYVFIQASFDNPKLIVPYRKRLKQLLSGRGIYFSELAGNIANYLNNFGPATYIRSEVSNIPKVLLSDENVAHLAPYRSRGMLNGKGVLMGLDVLSKTPFLVNFFGSSAAQVIVFIAKSGVGKTFAAQMAALGFKALGHHISAVDLKGGEWTKISRFTDVLKIQMNRFVNTLRIDDIPVDKSDCVFVYNLAKSATIQLFSIMVNLGDEGNEADLEYILSQAVEKVYSNLNGFDPSNPNTFHLTKNLKYSEVIEVLEEMKSAKSLPPELLNLVSITKLRIENFIGSSGELASIMDREISLSEVINHPFVVYSLDKNVDASMTLKDDIKVYMIQHLSRKKHYVRAKQGLHTVEVYEELQRSAEIGSSSDVKSNKFLKFVSGVVTGSRSDNVTVILILNSISALDHPDASPIKSNITTTIVGKLNQLDISKVAESLNCEDLVPYMEAVSSDNPKFRNNFAIRYDNGLEVNKTIYKVVVPPYVEKELRQRDVEED